MVLLGAALLTVLMLGSYSPDDPNWLSATDTPAKNLLGPVGAAIASLGLPTVSVQEGGYDLDRVGRDTVGLLSAFNPTRSGNA